MQFHGTEDPLTSMKAERKVYLRRKGIIPKAVQVEPRLCPDDARFGVATSTMSYLLVVCGSCNIAFRKY